MSKLIFMLGLPGSGKTYHAHEMMVQGDYEYISSDDLREEMWGDANDQQDPGAIFAEMERRTVRALNAGQSVIYDATNLNSRRRRATLKSIREQTDEFAAICYVVVCSISECKRRQGLRDRKVPDEVIDRMARQFQAPNYGEGWDTILIVGNGKQQDLDKEMERLRQTPHENPHHTTESIGAHCVAALSHVDELARKENLPEQYLPFLREATYYHDIGKRKTKVFHDKDGNPTDIAHYYSHDNVGAYMWLSGNKRGNWTDRQALEIANLIQWHMVIYTLPNKTLDGVMEWCAKRGFSGLFAKALWGLHEADRLAH